MARRPSAQRPRAQVRGCTDRAQVGQGTGQRSEGAQVGQVTGQRGHRQEHKLDRAQGTCGQVTGQRGHRQQHKLDRAQGTCGQGTGQRGHKQQHKLDRAQVRGGTSWTGHRLEGAQTGALVGQGTGQRGAEKMPVHGDTDIGTGQT